MRHMQMVTPLNAYLDTQLYYFSPALQAHIPVPCSRVQEADVIFEDVIKQ